MSIRKQLLERARLLEARQDQKATRLEREAAEETARTEDADEKERLKRKEVALEKLTSSKEARAAQKRLLDFSPHLWKEWRCPDCVAAGVDSTLTPDIRRFAETGDDSFDVFRCSACGYEISVPV